MNDNMLFLILLCGFSTVLSSNAGCSAGTGMPRKIIPVQSPGPLVTIGYKALNNDVPRQVIIDALTTGRTKTKEVFEKLLTELLLRNLTTPISEYDLSLWISALIARNDNPRNQNGIDMVADLSTRVGRVPRPMAYQVLTLCNARAVKDEHLKNMLKYCSPRSNYTHPRDLELDALVLKALACAASLPSAHQQNLDQFTDIMQEKAEKISFAQRNGYFENAYTTALVVQALTAYNLVIDPSLEWDEKEALDSLREESTVDSVAKIYYITMALNARRVPFLKELHQQIFDTQVMLKRDIRVTLSLRNEEETDVDFAVQLKVPIKWNLFEVMLKASNFSSRFRFIHSLNKNGEPLIMEIDGTANDPERGLYWVICVEQRTETFNSPALYSPFDGDMIILWYRSTDCPAWG